MFTDEEILEELAVSTGQVVDQDLLVGSAPATRPATRDEAGGSNRWSSGGCQTRQGNAWLPA